MPTPSSRTSLRVLAGKQAAEARNALTRRLDERIIELLKRRHDAVEAIATPEQARRRQRHVRRWFGRQIGPLPRRTPLAAKVTGRIDRGAYRIEHVVFASRPRHHVTANLYLPKAGRRPLPAVIIPCGHTNIGKCGDHYQSIGIAFARAGLAAFVVDPIGQGERHQVLDADGRPAVGACTVEHTLLATQSLLLGRHVAEFFVWDLMRAVDYLRGRPDIDAARIGCSGTSGGGTQTSYLSVADPRLAAAAPSCYITSLSRLMQTIGPQDGEQNFLRAAVDGIDHADYLEAFAPRPMLVLAATRDFFDIRGTWDTFGEAQRFYAKLGEPLGVAIAETPTGHGYGPEHRAAGAAWFRRHLLGAGGPVPTGEPDCVPFAQTLCTRTGEVLREYGDVSAFEMNAQAAAALAPRRRRWWSGHSAAQRAAKVRELIGLPEPAELAARRVGAVARRGVRIQKLLLAGADGTQMPALLFVPRGGGKRAAAIYLHGSGKAADAAAGGPIERLCREGKVVLAVDLCGLGEVGRTAGDRWYRQFSPDCGEAARAHYLGTTLVGLRTAEALAAARWLAAQPAVRGGRIELVGVGAGGIVALHAALLERRFAPVRIERTLRSWHEVACEPLHEGQFASIVPGALRYYDLPLLAEALARRPLTCTAPTDARGRAV